MKDKTSFIDEEKVMYSGLAVDKAIFVCSLLVHRTGQPA